MGAELESLDIKSRSILTCGMICLISLSQTARAHNMLSGNDDHVEAITSSSLCGADNIQKTRRNRHRRIGWYGRLSCLHHEQYTLYLKVNVLFKRSCDTWCRLIMPMQLKKTPTTQKTKQPKTTVLTLKNNRWFFFYVFFKVFWWYFYRSSRYIHRSDMEEETSGMDMG